MTSGTRIRLWLSLLMILVITGCSTEPAPRVSESPSPNPRHEKVTYPDPPPAVADAITELVRQWVAERADENDVFAIPPRGGQQVAGTLAAFHTVHQKDGDTYTVCVDFLDGTDTYDVDFFVDRGADGLSVRDAFLHKINGEVVSG